MMPPSDSESDDEEGGGSPARSPSPPPQPRRKKDEDDAPDPETVRKDMERLAMIRAKRAEDAKKRIEAEGYDRFAKKADA
mmetsp:Transcript_8447/g.27572  ORF Transcript_8447/g.27572 Transcript_8447/m.27572 type:complete len:80 (+) Transcript_8447:105-344(+)